ncbi:helix-turn-helix domain-containing protein [Brevibacillus sp. HD3.3A]|uniref:helix-turn-helix domain-containing protein n=1 Tax=Brevibacillus sp. HD3.3A TaxID=2738979 RepID=UPI00156B2135|nr:helix-turn-helix domain-containing protein [Brevibacillus sp. HD3.3A]UED70763.1 helix-turn-helix domain-containing protein [Brevibacillus sp. HD3.3A]
MGESAKHEDFPEILEVHHIQDYLGISKNQAYNLVNSGNFHVIRVGRLLRIPKKSFFDWVYGKQIDEQQG